MKIEFVLLSGMCRLRLPRSTAHHMCEANKLTAQPKGDDLTEHYEFNWCLRSPLGGRLLRPSVNQYHHDVPGTRCEKQATGNPPSQFLPATFWSLFPHGCHHQARGTTPWVPPHQVCCNSPWILCYEPASSYYLRQEPAFALSFNIFR